MRGQRQHGEGIAKGYRECHDDRELRYPRIATEPLRKRQADIGVETKRALLERREIAGVWLQDPARKPDSNEGNQHNTDRDPKHGEGRAGIQAAAQACREEQGWKQNEIHQSFNTRPDLCAKADTQGQPGPR